MNFRVVIPLAAAIGAALFAQGTQAAVSVIGGGPAELCYQAADGGASPFDYLIFCNQALAGTLTAKDRAATYVNRGVLKLAMLNVDSAARDFADGLKINGAMGEGYVDLGATLISHKRYAEAIADIDKGLTLGTKQPELAYYNRAMADEGLGNLQAAYDDYRHAVAIAPDFTLANDELKRFKIVDKPSGA